MRKRACQIRARYEISSIEDTPAWPAGLAFLKFDEIRIERVFGMPRFRIRQVAALVGLRDGLVLQIAFSHAGRKRADRR